MKIPAEIEAKLFYEGFAIDVVTTDGIGTAEFCAIVPGVTELRPGSVVG